LEVEGGGGSASCQRGSGWGRASRLGWMGKGFGLFFNLSPNVRRGLGEDSEDERKGESAMTSVLTRRKVRYKRLSTDLYSCTRPNWDVIENVPRICTEKGRSS